MRSQAGRNQSKRNPSPTLVLREKQKNKKPGTGSRPKKPHAPGKK